MDVFDGWEGVGRSWMEGACEEDFMDLASFYSPASWKYDGILWAVHGVLWEGLMEV